MIQFDWWQKIAFVCSFSPRKWGLATFAYKLMHDIYSALRNVVKPEVVTIWSHLSRWFCEPIECVISKNHKSSYMKVVGFINSCNIKLLSLQQEFGLFGGQVGSYIKSLFRKLFVTVISALYDFLENPLGEYYHIMVDICDCSEAIIVTNKRSIDVLRARRPFLQIPVKPKFFKTIISENSPQKSVNVSTKTGFFRAACL